MPSAAMQRRRDRWGTLEGGKQNESMQKYVQEKTMADVEHQRWLAHKEAALAANFPTHLTLNGISIPIFKSGELEGLGARRLKERALNLRDLVTATKSNFFGHHPEMVLNPFSPPEHLIQWMITVQVMVAEALGEVDLDHAAFGAKDESNMFSSPQQRMQQMQQPQQQQQQQQQQQLLQARRSAPCWSQEGLLAKEPPATPQHGYQSQSAFPWQQHGVNDHTQSSQPYRTPTVGEWRQRPPTHDGFSLVPPSMDETRDYDAMAIRQRGHGSVIALG